MDMAKGIESPYLFYDPDRAHAVVCGDDKVKT
jgi:hypothetical protein